MAPEPGQAENPAQLCGGANVEGLTEANLCDMQLSDVDPQQKGFEAAGSQLD